MPLFYRWRDKDPDKPRGDFQVSWRSWGRAVAGSLVSTLLERRLLHPGPPVRPAGGSRGPAGRPASGAGFPPSSRPVPFCSSLALILPDFSLARPFLFVQHCALCPILSLPYTTLFFRLSGAWECSGGCLPLPCGSLFSRAQRPPLQRVGRRPRNPPGTSLSLPFGGGHHSIAQSL